LQPGGGLARPYCGDGRTVSDEFTVPLCRGHHRELHRCGDEAEWWKKVGIDAIVPARALWPETHSLPITTEPAPGPASGQPLCGGPPSTAWSFSGMDFSETQIIGSPDFAASTAT